MNEECLQKAFLRKNYELKWAIDLAVFSYDLILSQKSKVKSQKSKVKSQNLGDL